jgi:hypothetical protein
MARRAAELQSVKNCPSHDGIGKAKIRRSAKVKGLTTQSRTKLKTDFK